MVEIVEEVFALKLMPKIDSNDDTVDLADVIKEPNALIQISSFVYCSRLLQLIEKDCKFTVLTGNPALRSVFESQGIKVIFLELAEPRLRDAINPFKIKKFRQSIRSIIKSIGFGRYSTIVLTVNCIDILTLETIFTGAAESSKFYFLPETKTNDVLRCSFLHMSIDENLQHLKRLILYRLKTYLGENSGGRHAYVDFEGRIIPEIRLAKTMPSPNKDKVGDRSSQCLFIASYSYEDDEAYFGGASFKEVLKIIVKNTDVKYKIHPGALSLRSQRYEALGMAPLLSEFPIETLVSAGDLVIGNDSTAMPRLAINGVTVVSISHMHASSKRAFYGADRERYHDELQIECGGGILAPKSLEQLELIILDWKSTAHPNAKANLATEQVPK